MKTDFFDGLSPMLVKELRQGLRTRTFVFSFIFLQILMTTGVSIGLAISSETSNSIANTSFFWAIVGMPLILLLPFTGMNAVSGELKANTLELIFLTRLSPRRILYGKWFSIVAQTLLFVCAVLPYLVLRYFMGGVNLVEELQILFSLFGISVLLTAITVGFSAYQTPLTRIVFTLVLIFSLQGILPFLLMRTFGISSGSFSGFGATSSWTVPIFILFAIGIVLLMLEIGTGKIAPPAENHSVMKRIIGLFFLLIAAGASFIQANAQGFPVFALILSTPILIGSLCEQPRWIPSIYARWATNPLKQFVGRFLYTGWQSGLLYSVVLLGGFAALIALQGDASKKGVLFFIAFAGALFLPIALIRAFKPRTEKTLPLFIGFQAICLTLAIVFSILDSTFGSEMRLWLSVLPTCSLVLLMGNRLPDGMLEVTQWVTTFMTVASFLALIILSFKIWRRIRTMETPDSASIVNHDAVA